MCGFGLHVQQNSVTPIFITKSLKNQFGAFWRPELERTIPVPSTTKITILSNAILFKFYKYKIISNFLGQDRIKL
jgi:hypothetical protein